MEKEIKKTMPGRDEIESHSSQLTNIRLSNIFRIVCSAEMDAITAMPPTIQHAVAYHSTLFTLFMETSEAYDQGVNDKIRPTIQKCIKQGEQAIFILKTRPNVSVEILYWSIENSKKLRYLMHTGLQNLKYFFRFGKQDPKGIDEILAIFGMNEAPELKEKNVLKLEDTEQ